MTFTKSELETIRKSLSVSRDRSLAASKKYRDAGDAWKAEQMAYAAHDYSDRLAKVNSALAG